MADCMGQNPFKWAERWLLVLCVQGIGQGSDEDDEFDDEHEMGAKNMN